MTSFITPSPIAHLRIKIRRPMPNHMPMTLVGPKPKPEVEFIHSGHLFLKPEPAVD